MRNNDYQLNWCVWCVWWMCSGRYLCLSQKLSATWRIPTSDILQLTSHVLTSMGIRGKQIHYIHQTHQTDWQPFVADRTDMKIIRNFENGRAAVPPGHICMWGSTAHKPASVWRLN